jgi:hypothetical protein
MGPLGESSPPMGPQGGYRGMDPEVPLHQRMDGGAGRVPIRQGHLGPSHNF